MSNRETAGSMMFIRNLLYSSRNTPKGTAWDLLLFMGGDWLPRRGPGPGPPSVLTPARKDRRWAAVSLLKYLLQAQRLSGLWCYHAGRSILNRLLSPQPRSEA